MQTYRVTIDAIPIPVFIIDVKGLIVEINAATSGFLNGTPDEAPAGQRISRYVEALDADPLILPERTTTLRTFVRLGAGSEYESVVTVSPLAGESGRWLIVVAPEGAGIPGSEPLLSTTMSVSRYEPQTVTSRPSESLTPDVVDLILSCRDEIELTRRVIEVCEPTVGSISARLFLRDSERERFRLVEMHEEAMSLRETAADLAARRGGASALERSLFERRVISDAESDLGFEDPETAIPLIPLAFAPLVWDAEEYGVLVVFAVDERPIEPEEDDFLGFLGRIVAGCLDRLDRNRVFSEAGSRLARQDLERDAIERIGEATAGSAGLAGFEGALVETVYDTWRFDWIAVVRREHDGRYRLRRSIERAGATARIAANEDGGAIVATDLVDNPPRPEWVFDALPEVVRPSAGSWKIAVVPIDSGGVYHRALFLGVRGEAEDLERELALALPLLDYASILSVLAKRIDALREITVARDAVFLSELAVLRTRSSTETAGADVLAFADRLESIARRAAIALSATTVRASVATTGEILAAATADLAGVELRRLSIGEMNGAAHGTVKADIASPFPEPFVM